MKNIISFIRIRFFHDLEQIERIGFPLALLLVAYGFFLSIINQPYFQGIYTVRNGFLCSLQQLMLFSLMILCLVRAGRGLTHKNGKQFFLYSVFALMFLFGFGEKIRWGQFIFELSIPEFFYKNNTQGQITLHNLKFGDFSVNKVIFGSFLAIIVSLYSLLLPFLYSKNIGPFRKLSDAFGLPVPKTTQILWYILLVVPALLIPDSKRGEVVQLAGVWSFAMFYTFPRNKKSLV